MSSNPGRSDPTMTSTFRHWEGLLISNSYQYVRQAIQQIKQVIHSYGGIDRVSLCFNGGKDCTVLLHLLAYILHQMGSDLSKIPLVYFKVDHEFSELYQFNNDMMRLYGFQLVEFDGRDMKQCLQQMLETYPTVGVIFMGQRRTDPHGANLSLVQKSDPGWPPIDRANSILDWSYKDVWDFLLDFQLPYCRLYELGFTSLGSLQTTIPNPWLLKAKLFFTPIIPEISPPVNPPSIPPHNEFPLTDLHISSSPLDHSPLPSSTTISQSSLNPTIDHFSKVSTSFEFPTKHLPCVQCIQQSNLLSPMQHDSNQRHLQHCSAQQALHKHPQDSLTFILSQQPNIHQVNISKTPPHCEYYEISYELFNPRPLLLQRSLSTPSVNSTPPIPSPSSQHLTNALPTHHILNLVRLHTTTCPQPSLINGIPYNSNSSIGSITIAPQLPTPGSHSQSPNQPSHPTPSLNQPSTCLANPHFSPNTIHTTDIQSIFQQLIPTTTADGRININLAFWPYLPAYLLNESELERDCRIQQPKKLTSPQSPVPSPFHSEHSSPLCRTCELKQQPIDPINSNLNVLKFIRVQSETMSTTNTSSISIPDSIAVSSQPDDAATPLPSPGLPATASNPILTLPSNPTPTSGQVSTTHPRLLLINTGCSQNR